MSLGHRIACDDDAGDDDDDDEDDDDKDDDDDDHANDNYERGSRSLTRAKIQGWKSSWH